MATKVPAFTFSGTHSSEVKNGYWYIYLKSSGTLKLTYAKKGVELCVVAGGAGGIKWNAAHDNGQSGGGGGTVVNKTGISVSAGEAYPIVIGAGGDTATWVLDGSWSIKGGTGGTSSAFGYSASGGKSGEGNAGIYNTSGTAGAGGSGTYAFGDSSLKRYGGGGGAGGTSWYSPGSGGEYGGGRGGYGVAVKDTQEAANAVAGTANSGGGGGGGGDEYRSGYEGKYGEPAKGGSGIVILRGTEDDYTNVYFNGVHLTEIYFNGERVTGLIYGGTRIFAEVMKRCSTFWAERFGSRAATPA